MDSNHGLNGLAKCLMVDKFILSFVIYFVTLYIECSFQEMPFSFLCFYSTHIVLIMGTIWLRRGNGSSPVINWKWMGHHPPFSSWHSQSNAEGQLLFGMIIITGPVLFPYPLLHSISNECKPVSSYIKCVWVAYPKRSVPSQKCIFVFIMCSFQNCAWECRELKVWISVSVIWKTLNLNAALFGHFRVGLHKYLASQRFNENILGAVLLHHLDPLVWYGWCHLRSSPPTNTHTVTFALLPCKESQLASCFDAIALRWHCGRWLLFLFLKHTFTVIL